MLKLDPALLSDLCAYLPSRDLRHLFATCRLLRHTARPNMTTLHTDASADGLVVLLQCMACGRPTRLRHLSCVATRRHVQCSFYGVLGAVCARSPALRSLVITAPVDVSVVLETLTYISLEDLSVNSEGADPPRWDHLVNTLRRGHALKTMRLMSVCDTTTRPPGGIVIPLLSSSGIVTLTLSIALVYPAGTLTLPSLRHLNITRHIDQGYARVRELVGFARTASHLVTLDITARRISTVTAEEATLLSTWFPSLETLALRSGEARPSGWGCLIDADGVTATLRGCTHLRGLLAEDSGWDMYAPGMQGLDVAASVALVLQGSTPHHCDAILPRILSGHWALTSCVLYGGVTAALVEAITQCCKGLEHLALYDASGGGPGVLQSFHAISSVSLRHLHLQQFHHVDVPVDSLEDLSTRFPSLTSLSVVGAPLGVMDSTGAHAVAKAVPPHLRDVLWGPISGLTTAVVLMLSAMAPSLQRVSLLCDRILENDDYAMASSPQYYTSVGHIQHVVASLCPTATVRYASPMLLEQC